MMYLVRDKDGTLKLCFEKPVRRTEWEDANNTIERCYWGLQHNPKINVSNQKNYPEHQMIVVPKSEDDYPEITWETEPAMVVFTLPGHMNFREDTKAMFDFNE